MKFAPFQPLQLPRLVLRKAGMKCMGVTPRKYEKKGVWHDAVSYRITQEEWSYHEN